MNISEFQRVGEDMMVRKVIIAVLLVSESMSESQEKIREDISKELSEEHVLIPWCQKIEKVRDVDSALDSVENERC